MVERGDRGRRYRQRVLHWGQTHSKFDKHVATHKATELCPVSQCHSPPAAVLPPCPPLLPLHNPLPSPFPRFALLHANCKSCGYSRCQIFDLPVNSLNAGYLSSSHLRQVHIPHTPLNLLIAQAAVRRLSFALLLFAPLSPVALCCVCSAASAAHKTHFRSAYPVCNRFQNVQRTDVTGRGVSNFAKLLKRVRGGSVG